MSYHPTDEVTTVIGMPLPFKNGEYKNRIDALRFQMIKEKIDFLLLFHQESMYYLFGYDQLGYWVYQTAVIDVNKEDITVLCRPADHNFIEGLPYVKEVRNWIDDSNKSPVELTIEMLFDLKALISFLEGQEKYDFSPFIGLYFNWPNFISFIAIWHNSKEISNAIL